MIVIGYGTGRCGTKSLASFLNNQEGFDITHEGPNLYCYPIFVDTDTITNYFCKVGAVVGDVAYGWIYYLQFLLKKYNGLSFINIKRDDDEVIESFWEYQGGVRNYKIFMENRWFAYPYNSMKPTKDAIARTIKEYRFIEEEASRILGNKLYVLDMYDLNDKNKLEELLNWLNCKNHNLTKFHENKRRVIDPFKNALNKRPMMDVLGGH